MTWRNWFLKGFFVAVDFMTYTRETQLLQAFNGAFFSEKIFCNSKNYLCIPFDRL